jgi:hypothetical protein
MKKQICICDYCQRDLSDGGASEMRNLCLFEETMPNNTGISLGIYWEPMIPHTMHFCGLACLKKWLEKEPK